MEVQDWKLEHWKDNLYWSMKVMVLLFKMTWTKHRICISEGYAWKTVQLEVSEGLILAKKDKTKSIILMMNKTWHEK